VSYMLLMFLDSHMVSLVASLELHQLEAQNLMGYRFLLV
jgi:hypothetical protein